MACQNEQFHRTYGAVAVCSTAGPRNTRPKTCAFCGVKREPGAAYKVWCQRHRHDEWICCDPVPADGRTVAQILADAR